MLHPQSILDYFILGFSHVIPEGFDHLLFIVCLFFLQPNRKKLFIQCSVFTLAHSVSLGMAAAGIIPPNASIIEPFIALTILITALENLLLEKVNHWNLLIMGVFGWIHGMGFAAAIADLGFPKNRFIASLLSFNLGVECAQIAVIGIVYLCISKPFSKKSWYKNRIVYPVSSVIACIAVYWTIERLLNY